MKALENDSLLVPDVLPEADAMQVLHSEMRCALTAATLGCAFVLTGCLSNGGASPSGEITAITRVADVQTLETRLKAGIRARTYDGAAEDFQGGLGQPNSAAGGDVAENGATPPGFSDTNLQESGVDEADRMKSDGQRLYVLTRPESRCCFGIGFDLAMPEGVGMAAVGAEGDVAGADPTTVLPELRILSLETNPPRASEQAWLVLGEDVGADELYLYSANGGAERDRLLVVGDSRGHAVDWYSPWTWRNGGIDLTEVDVAEPSAPTIRTRLHIDGYLIATRRIGDTLYLVSRYMPWLSGYEIVASSPDVQRANAQLLEAATLGDLLPDWSLDGVAQGDLFTAGACYLLPVGEEDISADLVTVTALDLRDLSAPPRSSCLLGPSEAIYASTEALYLATTRSHYTIATDVDPDGPVTLAYPLQMSTEVHKFALTEDGPTLRGSASVPGHLGWHQGRKSFRMGEHEGVLGIVTSDGSWEGEQIRLTMLGEQGGALVELAHLPNELRPATIGKPGEQLYAVRFFGARAFAVTFRTVDPLYVLDLSDPADPFIAGELETPGYSDYLHPVSATRLLGIGKDAAPAGVEGDGRGAWYQGVKLGLFDITNPQTPIEIDTVVIGKRGTEAGPLHDHHALAWLAADSASDRPARLALPVDLHETPSPFGTAPEDPWNWYDRTHTGLYLFDITDTAIVTRGAMVVETGAGIEAGWSNVAADRALIVGEDVHYLHGDEVWSAIWGDPGSLSAAQ